ncbi:MAG: hypothetical protein PHO46_10655 [Thermoguttaceae bacterium]|nr:hypothetical protein [Thermoguttaceae bacterium]
MTISELIAAREPDWQALEKLLGTYSNPFRSKSPEDVAQLTSLYRTVSSDLALAESHHLPVKTVAYLNNLVGRAHHCLYRKRKLCLSDFTRTAALDYYRSDLLGRACALLGSLFGLSLRVQVRS